LHFFCANPCTMHNQVNSRQLSNSLESFTFRSWHAT
jgi:hypothetical protein